VAKTGLLLEGSMAFGATGAPSTMSISGGATANESGPTDVEF
jgi:hypothetical protein